MIDLSGQTPFASGSNRHCFRHPDRPGRCLKLVRPENIEARYRRQKPVKKLLGKARLNDNRQEIQAHRQPALVELLRRGQDQLLWAHLPQFFGPVETAQGWANESELLTDSHGAPAETLEQYLQRRGFDSNARQLVEDLAGWLTQTGILTRNLLPHNLVIASRADQSDARLFLVDGLGAPLLPRLLSTTPAWRLHYIRKRIRRLYTRIDWELGDRRQSWEQAQKARR